MAPVPDATVARVERVAHVLVSKQVLTLSDLGAMDSGQACKRVAVNDVAKSEQKFGYCG